jgi:hypothetical protein
MHLTCQRLLLRVMIGGREEMQISLVAECVCACACVRAHAHARVKGLGYSLSASLPLPRYFL